MKRLIKELLREILISSIDNWENNTKDYGGVFGTPISIDNENGDMFYLFVGFTKEYGFSSFSYSFQLFDKEGISKTGLLVKRNDVNDIMPKELKNKKLIMPIIFNLTKRLLSKYKPKIVYRETTENLSEYSLLRYDEITKIFLNEFMYKLTKRGKDEGGNDFWYMELVNDITEPIDENVEYLNIPTKSEREKAWEDKVKSILPMVKQDIIRFNNEIDSNKKNN